MSLLDLRARDVMETDLVVLHTLTPIERAVETLEEYHISGAAVVDEGGSLVGVFSASDVLKRDHAKKDEQDNSRSPYYRDDPFFDTDEFVSLDDYPEEILGRELVADWMTSHVVAVEPDAPIGDVCRLMISERIHRVFVVEGKKLVGVISTFDVVRWLSGLDAESAASTSHADSGLKDSGV